MKPVIGINVDLTSGPPRKATIQANYFDVILKSGGIPVLIPPMPAADMTELLQRLNGLMFIGGQDYCPSFYGEKTTSSTVELADDERMDFDNKLLREAVGNTHLPVLGICAGCQLLNIGLGGTLVQDIPEAHPESKVQHSTQDGWTKGWHKHTVRILPDTKLSRIYGVKSIAVPTSHHQSVKALGRGLIVSARAEDEVIEAVELESRPFVIGVQWHPERDFEGNKALFVEFIKNAALHRSGSK